MKINALKLVCFSPTGTTKSVLQGIARGIKSPTAQLVDITLPEARNHPLAARENELLVVGVPVYMGRVPALLNDWLTGIKAWRTPAVGVVVYGNRAYDNALLELKDILKKQGCILVAGGAYIGEHSFSSVQTPTAHGRPDINDLGHAESFGRKIREKLNGVSSADELKDIRVPGSYPYEGVTKLWDVDFIDVSNGCVQCGACAQVCPVGAVDPEASPPIDLEKCITCCACIKACPQGARTMKKGPVMDAALRLNSLCQEPKEPAFFL